MTARVQGSHIQRDLARNRHKAPPHFSTKMPSFSAGKAVPTNSPDPFPLRPVFLAALAPALLGVFCAGFIAPPMLSSDTSVGLFTWYNFMEGGTWNAVRTVDPHNIAQNIEYPASWWAPGQYLPLGLLHSAGLPLGTGIIIISAVSTLLLGLGVAALAWAMRAPRNTLPWITLATCATHHAFYAFGFFIGGEAAQVAIWPWAIFAAWTLRNRTLPLIIVLPAILLIGTFGKHSFAIYALSILAFLWVDAFRNSAKEGIHPTRWGESLWATTLTLCAVGILFALGRHFLIDTNHTPGTSGVTSRGFLESWGYAFYGPILGLSGIDKTLGYVSYQLWGVKGGDLWSSSGWLLSLLSPLALALYFWLILRKSPIEQLAGIVALTTGTVFFILLWAGGAISLDSRHYQPTAILLLAVMGAKILDSNRVIAIGSRILLGWSILFGCGTLAQRHIKMRSSQSETYNKSENLTLGDMPQSVQEELGTLASLDHSVVTMENWAHGNALYRFRHPTTRFLLVDNETEYTSNNERYGRAPRLVIALQNRELDKPRAKHLRESFKDYREDEWTSYELDGWVIWQAGDAVTAGTLSNQSE